MGEREPVTSMRRIFYALLVIGVVVTAWILQRCTGTLGCWRPPTLLLAGGWVFGIDEMDRILASRLAPATAFFAVSIPTLAALAAFTRHALSERLPRSTMAQDSMQVGTQPPLAHPFVILS